MLAVEAKTDIDTSVSAYEIAGSVNYPLNEVLYHIRKCEESGFFSSVRHYVGEDDCQILDISEKGDRFLDSVRSDTKWDKVKRALISAGATTFAALIKQAVSNAFGA